MPALRIVSSTLAAVCLLADARRVVKRDNVVPAVKATGLLQTKQARFLDACQDYEDTLGFGLGDTVRISGAGESLSNHVGIVGCRDEAQSTLICLQGGKGCHEPDHLRHIGTLEFTLTTVKSATTQIAGAIAGDIKDEWQSVRMRLMSLSLLVSDKVSAIGAELSVAADVCDAESRAVTKAKLAQAFASIKARLAMIATSASDSVGSAQESAEALAAVAVSKFVKLQALLAEKADEIYEAELKDIVEALEKYLSGIASAVTDVPDELVPDALVANVDSFSTQVADLSGKLAAKSEDLYEATKEAVAALQASAGRLIAELARRWAGLKAALKEQAGAAMAQLAAYQARALEAACNFDVREQAAMAFEKVKDRFQQVVAAVQSGKQQVQESLAELADFLAGAVAAVTARFVATVHKVQDNEKVQQLIALLKAELEELRKLIATQSSIVRKSLSAFLTYFSRFIPKSLLAQLTKAQTRAQELVASIRSQIEELTSIATDGETTGLEMDDADDVQVS